MDDARAIGGYFERDDGGGAFSLPDGVLLNSGRNALRHIVRMIGITHIHIPYYICPVVVEALVAEGCEVERYALSDDMLPDRAFPREDYVLYVNYFGVCGRNVDWLAAQYPNLIVDCAQAYFAHPKGRASFSSPRKFFGVPDGGVAYGVEAANYLEDVSDIRKGHLIERKKNGATTRGYELFRQAEASLDGAAVLEMSAYTKNCLRKVDLQNIKEKRLINFAYLHHHLSTSFPLRLAVDDVPMVYPYMTTDLKLRMRLINAKIFIASYWSGVRNSRSFQERILPLPIDQRYGEEDMKRILEVVKS